MISQSANSSWLRSQLLISKTLSVMLLLPVLGLANNVYILKYISEWVLIFYFYRMYTDHHPWLVSVKSSPA